jgi:hypothetical protein
MQIIKLIVPSNKFRRSSKIPMDRKSFQQVACVALPLALTESGEMGAKLSSPNLP